MENVTWGRKMKKAIVYVVIIVLIGIMIKTFLDKEVAKNQLRDVNMLGEEVAIGAMTAPDFTLKTLANEEVALSDLRGKNIILNFWATWCIPCKAEMPDFQQYYKQYAKEDNVEIIAVNVTYSNDTPKRVEQFIEAFDLTFPIVLEPEQSVSNLYEIMTLPSTFFIDAQGEIKHYIKGPMNTSNLREYVHQLNE